MSASAPSLRWSRCAASAAFLALASCSGPIADRDSDGVTAEAGDCDDLNNTLFPGANEVPGDGIDQDCDGADTPAPPPTDVDQDGVTAEQGDCDDLNAAVKPGARERSGDGVDSNCDGDETPALGDDLFANALGIVDLDLDGAISFEEFEAACATSAMVVGTAEPGVVNTHASCAGTNQCRGMILHPWGQLFEHDCAGVNTCTGWSCTETAPDQGRDGATLFGAAGCSNCHSGADGAFKVEVPPGQDVAAYVGAFLDRPDERFRGAIAFGLAGLTPSGSAYQNMPAHYSVMSRAEIDTLIAWVRASPLEGAPFTYADEYDPAKP
jgi:hypothetical protein